MVQGVRQDRGRAPDGQLAKKPVSQVLDMELLPVLDQHVRQLLDADIEVTATARSTNPSVYSSRVLRRSMATGRVTVARWWR